LNFSELPQFFAEAPLYQVRLLENVPPSGEVVDAETLRIERRRIMVPKDLHRDCSRCGKGQNWLWNGIPGSAEYIEAGQRVISYQCMNCRKAYFSVWCRFWVQDGKLCVEKIGQHPKPTISLPPAFEKALGESRGRYIKGMLNRHNNHGIGALAYFRRIIEDTVDDMLGVLEAAMVETRADTAAIAKVQEARAGTIFEVKAKLAADAIPEPLKPGGWNPFGDLHKLYSIGVHDLSDEDCCEIVDGIDNAMKYVYTELKSRTQAAADYRDAAATIQQKLAELRSRKEG